MSCKNCENLKVALRDLLKWEQSDAVQSAFTSAWVHGVIPDAEFSKKAQEMFKKANELVDDKS